MAKKITNGIEYREAASRMIELQKQSDTPEKVMEMTDLVSSMRDYSATSQNPGRHGDGFTSAGGSSDPMPPKKKQAASTGSRLTFRDQQSGQLIYALNNDEQLSQSVLPDGIAGEYLVASILGRGERLHDLHAQMIESGVPQSAMAGNVFSSGGVFIPDNLSAQFIDLARAASVVVRAGARTITAPAGTLSIARLLTDPEAHFRGEGASIDPSSASFGDYKIVSKFIGCLVPVTIELLEDAPNAGQLIQNSIANAIAQQLDLYALRGPASGAAFTGVLNCQGVHKFDYDSVSGTQPTSYPFRVVNRAVRKILDSNYTGDVSSLSWITSPGVRENFMNLFDSTNQPLTSPSWVTELRKLHTTNVPSTLGGGGDESECYFGDFTESTFFVRRGLTFEILRSGKVVNSVTSEEENLLQEFKVVIRAAMRLDFLIMRPTWFAVVEGVPSEFVAE